MATVFVAKERGQETRVAATPATVKRMVQAGLSVVVEPGAGLHARFSDAQYAEAGAALAGALAVSEGLATADVWLTVAPPTADQIAVLRKGTVVIGFLAPLSDPARAAALALRGVSAFAMEFVPRISRAQSMDALSSQANLAGYKAVLLAATHLDKVFPLLMTAAGTLQPARVVILGAGVAGLQAIATARRLGALVEVSDVRPAVKEQVESLGAKYIDVPPDESAQEDAKGYATQASPEFLARQRAIVEQRILASDVVITTALVPGRKAPRLITADTVSNMRPGAVIVDMAVEAGGNCELSVLGEIVRRHGVTLIGLPNLPATMPHDASLMYARNVDALLALLVKEGVIAIDLEDEVVQGALLTHEGKITHAGVALAAAQGGHP